MNKARIGAAIGTVAILVVTACAGNTHPAAGSAHLVHRTTPVVEVTDPSGLVCTALDNFGYCPGDDPSQQASDPNGVSCPALDNLGYCPGDDPSPMQQWCNGDGYSDYQAVQNDLTQLQTDSANDDLGSVMSDGSSLLQDASNGVQHLPPVTNLQKVEYGAYMGLLFIAGGKASTRDLTGAVAALQKASQYTNTVNNLTDQCSS